MEFEYTARDGSHINDEEAVVIGERLDELSKVGEVTAATVVEDATTPESPLHRFFEWDDTKAAAEYRLYQARVLIGAVQVIVERANHPPVSVRAFVRVTSEDSKRYLPIVSALRDDDFREQVVQRALREMQSWERRYRHLCDLSRVMVVATETLNGLIEPQGEIVFERQEQPQA